jgi:hypothetical protein
MDKHRILDCASRARAVPHAGDALRCWKISQPHSEIEQRQSMFEEGSASRLRATIPPTRLRTTEGVRARPHSIHSPQFAALKEAGELLHVGAKAVVVPDCNLATASFGGAENSLDSARGQRNGPLAQHMLAGPQSTQNVRFMQMVGRRYDHRVDVLEFEQILDVGDNVAH